MAAVPVGRSPTETTLPAARPSVASEKPRSSSRKIGVLFNHSSREIPKVHPPWAIKLLRMTGGGGIQKLTAVGPLVRASCVDGIDLERLLLSMHQLLAAVEGEPLTRKIAIMATSERIDAYGGHQISEDALSEFAAQMMEQGFPMNIDHDPSQRMKSEVIRAWTERHPNGYLVLKAEFEASAEEWARAGDRTGMSISYTEPISESAGAAAFSLIADASWFDESVMKDASAVFASQGYAVSTFALYQFAHDPDAWVYLTVAIDQIKGLPTELLATMIWDGLRALLARFKNKRSESSGVAEPRARIELAIELPDGTTSTLHLETDSGEEIKHAIDKFADIVRDRTDTSKVPSPLQATALEPEQ